MSAVDVLREYADALRGDWSDIDGRSALMALGAIADAIESDDPPSDVSLRLDADLCPWGGGHWADFCSTDRCGDGGTA